MNDSKFNYTAVRIYNHGLVKSLEDAYKRTETSFASNRSSFLVHLIELGLGVYMGEIEIKRLNSNESGAFHASTDIDDLSGKLDKYIAYSRDANEHSEEKLEICQGLAAAIFNILLDSLEGEFVDREAAEAGKYDKVPDRFRKGKNKA